MLRPFLQSTAQRRTLGLLAGSWLDARLTDPPNRWHPVAGIGRLARALERYTPADPDARREFGTAVAVALPLISAAKTGIAVRSAGGLPIVGRLAETAVGAVLLTLASSQRTLLFRAREVADALDGGDLEAARTLLGTHLVSRDTSALDASEVAAATIESVAENLSDGVVAPWCWFVAAGAPGAWAYRAVNTLDAMWGYHDGPYEELGMTAARLDDAMNLVPSRVTALAILAAARGGGTRTWWRDHGNTASPNAGHPMAAMAGALGVELRKGTEYTLGAGQRPPSAADIRDAIVLAKRASLMALIALAITASRRPR
jgi:adenosylcobinamide-phosphate synthase